MKELDVPA